jgi:hypothetical protein
MGKLVRKTFSIFRLVIIITSERLYQIDSQKQGTNGKREHRKSRKDAETRAQSIGA